MENISFLSELLSFHYEIVELRTIKKIVDTCNYIKHIWFQLCKSVHSVINEDANPVLAQMKCMFHV